MPTLAPAALIFLSLTIAEPVSESRQITPGDPAPEDPAPGSRRAGRVKRLLPKLALAVGSLIVAAAVPELVARVVFLCPPPPPHRGCFEKGCTTTRSRS